MGWRMKFKKPVGFPTKSVYAALAVVLIVAIYFVARGVFRTEEDRIRDLIRRGVTAVEDEDIDTIGSIVSSKYHGYYGTNKEEALRMGRSDLENLEDLKIKLHNIEIAFQEGQADVLCYFKVSGVYLGSNISDRLAFRGLPHADAEEWDKAHLVLEKELPPGRSRGGEWRIIEFELLMP
jgi:hypothetical protein